MTTVKLDHPIKKSFLPFSSVLIEEVELRRPKVKDLRGIDFTRGIDSYIDLIPRISNLSKKDVESMDAADFSNVCEVLSNYLTPKKQVARN
jgi:hypothetical protein